MHDRGRDAFVVKEVRLLTLAGSIKAGIRVSTTRIQATQKVSANAAAASARPRATNPSGIPSGANTSGWTFDKIAASASVMPPSSPGICSMPGMTGELAFRTLRTR
jgi:hypothetical protein